MKSTQKSYAKYISSASIWKEAVTDVDNDKVDSLRRLYQSRSALYAPLPRLFVAMILYPDTLMHADGTFDIHDLELVKKNQELFDDIYEYFEDSPFGNMLDDMHMTKELRTRE